MEVIVRTGIMSAMASSVINNNGGSESVKLGEMTMLLARGGISLKPNLQDCDGFLQGTFTSNFLNKKTGLFIAKRQIKEN